VEPAILSNSTAPGPARGQDPAPAQAPPNIVFLRTGGQRRDALGCYGNPEVSTLAIDRLAADGVLFEQATVNSAIGTPSRACFFTGQDERRHGVNFNSGAALAPSAWQRTDPVLLRNAGYFTGYVGKNHGPVGPRGCQGGILQKCFDFWYGGHGRLTFYPKKRRPICHSAPQDTQPEILREPAAACA
jgi:arylsulfatase A-like enzyme